MGINLRLSSSASGTRNLGPVNMGGGANLLERSLFSSSTPTLPYSQWYTPGNGSPAVSTSDYYLLTGLSWARPYDLDAMGSDGAAIKAANGGLRYVWPLMTDHGGNWVGSEDLFIGFSNDPQVFPDPASMRPFYSTNDAISITDSLGQSQSNWYCYQVPWIVYNPDSAGDKFWIYMESQGTGGTARQHQLGLITTNDFVSVTKVGPVIPNSSFSGWSSYGRPNRTGVNTWEVYALGKGDGSAVTPTFYKYTSTDGLAWTPDYTTVRAGNGPFFTLSGQKQMLCIENASGNSYLSFLAVDNTTNVSLGTYTRISSAFGDNTSDPIKAYPGPTYLQEYSAYEEDGVISIYATRGWPVSSHDGTNAGPYLDNHPSFYNITGGISNGSGGSGTILDVTSWPSGNPPLAVGFRIGSSRSITALGTGTGGVGTYTVSSAALISPGTTLAVYTNGGLWHQFTDQYYWISDATAAASAAPLGVKASCTAGVVTIQWNNSLPHQNYRVYRGTTVGTQATLIGDVTGTSITDTPTAGSQYFYKVVTMNSGEQKSRVVSVYASNNTAMVNKHVNRVINDGGSGYDVSFIATAASWLTSNDAWKYVQWWTDVRFGYKLNGSSFISKIYDLGTTYMPRGGDYTPDTSNVFPSTSSNTSYSSTGFRGTTPSWVNNATTAKGYFGNGKANNIQRWSEVTFLAAYQKPSTGAATFFGHGENGGIYLQHSSGTPGTVNFAMVCDKVSNPTVFTTATATPGSATAAAVAAGVFDGTNLTAYYNGTPGTPQSGGLAAGNSALLNDTILRGQYGEGTTQSTATGPVLASGSRDTRFTYKTKAYNLANNEAQFTGAGLAVFNKGLSQSIVQSWGALYA